MNRLDPTSNSAFEYLQQLWPCSLCELIALETNRYAMQKGRSKWNNTTTAEIWKFLGISILMGIHRLPRINNYWSRDKFLGLPVLRDYMSCSRFWSLWTNLHVVDNHSLPATRGLSRKVKPVLDTLGRTFLQCYNPSQQLAVDEGMVKYKGHVKGKVLMPKKPIKTGFKIWSCSCSCCGYLCTFQLYEGKPDGKSEKGLVMRVVKDLLEPFAGFNHVLYCDNYYSSGPLLDSLAKNYSIYVAATIKRNAKGFPESLKGLSVQKGEFVSRTVGDVCYTLFSDHKDVCFVTNAFPEHLESPVPRLQKDGVLHRQYVPALLPAYNKFMCGVDRSNQLGRTYDFDRKSVRFWKRLYYKFFHFAVNNAYILYKRI